MSEMNVELEKSDSFANEIQERNKLRLQRQYANCKTDFKYLVLCFSLSVLGFIGVCARKLFPFDIENIVLPLFCFPYFIFFHFLAKLCKANEKNRLLWLFLTFQFSYFSMLFAIGAMAAVGKENKWL